MINFCTQLKKQMTEELEKVSESVENTIQLTERSYAVVKNTLGQLKEFFTSYAFKDQKEEIMFFKEIKPKFLSELIYHGKLFHIEARKPVGSEEMEKAHYRKAIENIATFFDDNKDFYTYIRMGKTDLDERLFLNRVDAPPIFPDLYTCDTDPTFCSTYSYLMAMMQAYEQLRDHLQITIEQLAQGQLPGNIEKVEDEFTWSDKKVGLLEFAIAIHERGAVNNGNVSLRKIVNRLEAAFNVRIPNFYRTEMDMYIRKKDPAPYLRILTECVERRMKKRGD